MRTITIKVQVPGAKKAHHGKKRKAHGKKAHHKQTRKQRAASLRNLKKARRALRG